MERIDNYEYAVELLREFEHECSDIYLDLGNVGKKNAKYVEQELKMHYVGIGNDAQLVQQLINEGYEGYVYQSDISECLVEKIRECIGNRKIGCICLNNILETTMYAEKVVSVVYEMTKNTQIPVIAIVYNAEQYQVAAEILCNKIETPNRILFNEKTLIDLFEQNGLHMINKNDIQRTKEERDEQRSILPMMTESSFSKLIQQLRNGVTNMGDKEQMVRLFIPGPKIKSQPKLNEKVPFLSIVTRTTGNRIETLKEVLLCLTGQECTDFEVLIMGHNVKSNEQMMIQNVIENVPQWMKEKVRFIKVEGGNRSTPLNKGFSAARGQYITILDDDDIVFGNWVQTFKELSRGNYGKILKSVTVRQEYEPVTTQYSQNTSRAVTGFIRDYPSEFDFLQMLHHNQCPGLCLAFPNSVFKEFGLRFDETLNTIEDWDFIMRAVFLCDVASSSEVTNIYRWWKKGESSQTLHKQDEWQKNYYYVQEKLNSQYMILPPGNMKRIVHLIDAYNNSFSKPIVEDEELASMYRMNEKRWTADQLLNSNSWRITKPLRFIKRIMGVKTCIPNLFTATEQELDELIANIYDSKSWRYTARFRKG